MVGLLPPASSLASPQQAGGSTSPRSPRIRKDVGAAASSSQAAVRQDALGAVQPAIRYRPPAEIMPRLASRGGKRPPTSGLGGDAKGAAVAGSALAAGRDVPVRGAENLDSAWDQKLKALPVARSAKSDAGIALQPVATPQKRPRVQHTRDSSGVVLHISRRTAGAPKPLAVPLRSAPTPAQLEPLGNRSDVPAIKQEMEDFRMPVSARAFAAKGLQPPTSSRGRRLPPVGAMDFSEDPLGAGHQPSSSSTAPGPASAAAVPGEVPAEAEAKERAALANLTAAEDMKDGSPVAPALLPAPRVAAAGDPKATNAAAGSTNPAAMQPEECAAALQEVSKVTRWQLAEIKQMKNPPQSVRQALEAVWLCLRCEKIEAKGGPLPSSERGASLAKLWKPCLQMIVDDNFITRIMEFDPKRLEKTPLVANYLLGLVTGKPDETGKQLAQPVKPPAEPPTTRPSLRQSQSVRRLTMRGSHAASRSSLALALDPAAADEQQDVEKLRHLTIDDVARAHGPSAALLRWMLAVLSQYRLGSRPAAAVLAGPPVDVAAQPSCVSPPETPSPRPAAPLMPVAPPAYVLKTRWTDAVDSRPKLAEQGSSGRKEQLEKLERSFSGGKASLPPVQAPRGLFGSQSQDVELRLHDLCAEAKAFSELSVPFEKGSADVIHENAEQLAVLKKLAQLLRRPRSGNDWSPKIQLEATRSRKEPEGLEAERAVAVYRWLVDAENVEPGSLRLVARVGAGPDRAEANVGVRLLPELEVLSGPQQTELSGTLPPGLFFEFSQAILTSATMAIVEEIARWMQAEENSAVSITIEGHADQIERDVSQARAHAVRDLLAFRGICSTRMKTQPCKAWHPASRADMSLNRRVQVFIQSGD
eukprot:TRINITY_DN20995_c0_g2_i1.p1 TRINITY_DN20995_c0_g2~~TRINITY_DN20995_c0_g2_i1.p1  ORF type:complete len:872 (+),score=224.72 TRINITY_DN20995_c0_g2_i1:189-2804(+)